MAKKFYVTRGGRDICITQDYNQALLFSKNKEDRVQEFSNYHVALKLLHRMVESALQHSEKPIEIANRIIDLCGDVNRIELFARDAKHGWDVWGNEAEGSVDLETYRSHYA